MRPENDKFGRWIGMSLALHLGLISIAVIWPSLLTLRGDSQWGSSTGGSDGVKVRIAAGIPGIALPSPPIVQEDAAANESKGLYTSEPAPKAKPEEKKVDEAPAVKIPEKTVRNRPEPKPRETATPPPTPVPANAVPYGQGGRPAVEYGRFSTGAGEAGIQFGGDGAFGDMYGWYVEAMRRTISNNWLQALVNTNLRSAPRVYVSFTIARDGTIDDAKIAQPSGIPTLDNSALRAILRSSPLQPLPGQYRGSSVAVSFYFEYVR
jgi:protein TonB